jgi:hypothetical protein
MKCVPAVVAIAEASVMLGAVGLLETPWMTTAVPSTSVSAVVPMSTGKLVCSQPRTSAE